MWRIAYTGLIIFCLLFSSCKNESFNIGTNLVEPSTKVFMTDTLTVKLSNLAVDSVITSYNRWNKNIAFAGYYNDRAIGKLHAQSYIEFNRTNNAENNAYAFFDSIMLVLIPNGHYYGDTLKPVSFKISKLAKEIEMRDDGYMYSTSYIPKAEGKPLAEATFKMRPNMKEEVEIKLDKVFGESLFKGIRDSDLDYDSENFLTTFPGLSISAGSKSCCVYGFGVNDTSCFIRIYYSVSSTTKEQKTMEFKPNLSKLFYQYISEKLPDLEDLNKSDPKPSHKTRNMGILMTGTPMYTRIEFPYLNNFLHLAETVVIKEAILYIRPVYKSYDTIPLPPKLNLFYHDPAYYERKGTVLSSRSASGGSQALTGNLPENWRYQQYPCYSFDITDYIASQYDQWGYNKRDLNIAIPEDDEATTIQRLLFGNQKFKYLGNIPDIENQVQLKIVYLTYNK